MEAAQNSQDRYIVLVFLRLFPFLIYLLFNYSGICCITAYNSLRTYKLSFSPRTKGMNPQNLTEKRKTSTEDELRDEQNYETHSKPRQR